MMQSLFSRRRFVAATAFAFSPAMAQGILVPQSTTIAAATNKAQLLTIPVQINGQGPFRFVVDTGADRSVIAGEVAAALGLERGTRVLVEGVIRSVPADTVRLAELAVGPVTRRNMSVPVLPRAQLAADGYLGLDVIDGYRVTFDFRNSTLALGEPFHMPRHMALFGALLPGEIMVPVAGQHGHLYAFNCGIDGIRAVTFIDTGAEISVGNTKLFDALVAKDPSYNKRATVPMTGVTGGTVIGRVTSLKRVRMNALSFDNGNVAIANLQIFGLWGLSGTPALLIGMDWLRRFARVSIDYGRKELRFNFANLAARQVASNT
jgi:predicted aspartyl protease